MNKSQIDYIVGRFKSEAKKAELKAKELYCIREKKELTAEEVIATIKCMLPLRKKVGRYELSYVFDFSGNEWEAEYDTEKVKKFSDDIKETMDEYIDSIVITECSPEAALSSFRNSINRKLSAIKGGFSKGKKK